MCVRYSRVGRQLVVVDVTHIGQAMHVQIFVIVNGVVLKIGRYRCALGPKQHYPSGQLIEI